MTGVLQSGNVTPTHLASWTTDGVIQDAGVTYTNTFGVLQSTVQQINFNLTNNDNAIPVNLPPGFTRYRVDRIVISGATESISTATVGVFTEPAAAGLGVVASGTALTLTSNLTDTNNNMQSLTIVNQNTLALSDTTLYFRTQTPQGSAALANVTVIYEPLP